MGEAKGAAAARVRDALERRLVVLMAARLALALLSLLIALAVDTSVDLGIEDWRGLYGTVALAFVATALYGVVLPRVRHKRRFAAVNVARASLWPTRFVMRARTFRSAVLSLRSVE